MILSTAILSVDPRMFLIACLPSRAGSSLGLGTAFSCHVSLALSSLKHFHSVPLSFITLTFVKNIPSPI